MGRRFTRDKCEQAHQRLHSWASWIERYVESSALDARIVNYLSSRSGIPGPIVPEVMKPLDVLETEQAVDKQTITVQRNIRCYYGIISKNSPLYTAVTKGQREHFLLRIASALFP